MKFLAFEVSYDPYDYDDDDYDDYGRGTRIVGPIERFKLWREEHTSKKLAKTPPSFPGANYTQIIDMNSVIFELDPDTSAFQTMLMKLARNVEAPTIEWLEDELFPRVWDGKFDHTLWGSWDWDDSPRKPLTHMTLSQKMPYGTLVRMAGQPHSPGYGKAYRFIGGDTFECS